MTHHITPAHLSIDRIGEIIESGCQIDLSKESTRLIQRCRDFLDRKIAGSDEPVYGINTGFGSLCNISIGNEDLARLQENLVKSHACGLGEKVDPEIVRLMILLKVMSLSFGNSGVQVSTVQRLIDMYNADVIPVVYRQGSLGASGDLAPLANMCLPLIGLGEVYYKGEIRPAAEVLAELKWEPVSLTSKEGLALLNGTQFMSAHAVYAILRAKRLSALADKIGALSLDVYDGRIEPFGDEVNAIRPHPGQLATAQAVRSWLDGSEMISRPKKHVQDPYSFRCIPQVHGTMKDTLAYVSHVIEIEVNSPTDNPTIFPDKDIIVSAGNFHGEPIAIPMDFLAIAVAELASISERRIYKLISGTRNLPSFLVANPGLNSGFMIPQYAAASIVNQSKGLCWPTSCDTIPSSQGQEDHVSMGGNSATKLVAVIANTERVLAIELLNAMQALDLRRPLHTSPKLEQWHAEYRCTVPFVINDTPMSPLIERSVEFIQATDI
ncbi:MAG: histidine ammonia-lyase [Bacteroides sp.]|nr:histidine ammonia-lyase [Bacteroides sp.]MCM1412821.1 histidine ammonia-lyase [Bacteroides sp.]MCM1471490.1 histidine ammonia-lyase [Bacteroides sp.]